MTLKNVSNTKVTIFSILSDNAQEADKICWCESVSVRGWGRESDNICKLPNGPETKMPYLKSSSTATRVRYYLPYLQ